MEVICRHSNIFIFLLVHHLLWPKFHHQITKLLMTSLSIICQSISIYKVPTMCHVTLNLLFSRLIAIVTSTKVPMIYSLVLLLSWSPFSEYAHAWQLIHGNMKATSVTNSHNKGPPGELLLTAERTRLSPSLRVGAPSLAIEPSVFTGGKLESLLT